MRPNLQVSSDRFDRHLAQWVCCGGAPVMFVATVIALTRFSPTPAEFFIGLLAAANLMIGLIILGIVAGPSSPQT